MWFALSICKYFASSVTLRTAIRITSAIKAQSGKGSTRKEEEEERMGEEEHEVKRVDEEEEPTLWTENVPTAEEWPINAKVVNRTGLGSGRWHKDMINWEYLRPRTGSLWAWKSFTLFMLVCQYLTKPPVSPVTIHWSLCDHTIVRTLLSWAWGRTKL